MGNGDSARIGGRKLAVYLVVCFLLGAVAVAGAAHLANSVYVDGGVPVGTPDGLYVTVDGETQMDLRDPTTFGGTANIVTEAGNATFFSTGQANVTIHKDEITGTWTRVTDADVDQNIVQIDPADKQTATIGGGITTFEWRDDMPLNDDQRDFSYDSSGEASLTLTNVEPEQEIVAVDASSDAFLDVATSDSGGSITFDSLDGGSHDVELQTTGSFHNPELTNAAPTGDLDSEPTDFSVDVADADFDRGDSVDVTIDFDGTQIHSETITSNQTVSTSIPSSGQNGGEHDWSVTAEPDYGATTSEGYTYRVPDTLTIRNETDHSDIIEAPITSDVTFFGDEEIITRETDTGTIRMTGLPVNQDFIAEVEPSTENLTERALYLNSIYQQQSVYLLNTSAVDTIEARFVLDDPTGEFGPQSILFVKRPINTSDGTSWQTVHSDEFGAEGVTATLEEGQRYRIEVQNADGDTQRIGPYRSDTSETVTVQPGTPQVNIEEFTNGWGANAVLDNRTLEYRYSDPTGESDQVTVWIHEQGDPSNRLQANESYFDLGNFSATTTVTENESEQTWVVNFLVDRDGEEFVKRVTVSNRANIFPGLPEPWGAMAGIGLLLLLAGAFSVLNAATGAVVVAAVGGILWWIGLLGGATTGIGVILGLFTAVLVNLYSNAGP